jgi:hypothetical protein
MTQGDLARTPPVHVRRQLRREVGFGCPAAGCGNPYLEYHHFDPPLPWNVEKHHDPTRMVALCATHHAKADAWSVEQLRQMKANAGRAAGEVRGRFEWMREDVLAVVGGNYYYETPNMVVFRDQPLIWFERDDERRLLLNLNMLSTSGEPRTSLVNNDWLLRGEPEDVESPPNGSNLRVRYANGDDVSIRFREWSDAGALAKIHERALVLGDELTFPLVTAEVSMFIGGTDQGFRPGETKLGGVTMTGCVASRCGGGLVFS